MEGSDTPSIHKDQLIAAQIEQLIAFALHNRLLHALDRDAVRNAILDLFGLNEPSVEEFHHELPDSPVPLLEPLLDAAVERGLIPDDTLTFRDLFDARIMGLLLPRPSELQQDFEQLVRVTGIASATDWFYKLNIDCNYIRMDRISRNGYWRHGTSDGDLEITINLSKPEKDPREIALLKSLPQSHYPKCLLCKENVGYAGRPDHPGRQNLRVIPVTLKGESWFFQYSPYVYYNEHSIVFRGEHTPMKISPATFERLLDFVEQFPHYFIGSNADLPIVGGSILNHDHFQAGRHVFPMETAAVKSWVASEAEPQVQLGLVQWPMSVLRVQSIHREALLRVASDLLAKWRGYSDSKAGLLAYSEGEQGIISHNTITPIARLKDNGIYELDLVLRNNRTSEEHPDGIFHPHQELHHIKKENIGLIEVMGLAVLPGRLQAELGAITAILAGEVEYQAAALNAPNHPLNKHAPWIRELIERRGTKNTEAEAQNLIREEVGNKFHAVLQDAGVYKSDKQGQEAFQRFLTHVIKG